MKKFLLSVSAACLAAFVIYNAWILIHVAYYNIYNPTSTAFMRLGAERIEEKDTENPMKYQWVDYDQISIHLKRALIASEDGQFVEHNGFDWVGIETAFFKNIRKGRIVSGGSTISQQLAKNLFLSPAKTPWRKIEEGIITVMIETVMSKRRILEIYLNVIEWGEGVYGAEAAARRYYKQSAARLNPAQAAKLASMVTNPRFYETNRQARGLNKKTRIIQGRMNKVSIPQ